MKGVIFWAVLTLVFWYLGFGYFEHPAWAWDCKIAFTVCLIVLLVTCVGKFCVALDADLDDVEHYV